MDLNLLRDKIHENAVKHGFWDGERSIAERLALIHSEVSEALECDRIGRHFNKTNLLQQELDGDDKDTFIRAFRQAVKDTFEDELADVVIRCLDLCGHLGVDVPELPDTRGNPNWFWYKNEGICLSEKLCGLHSTISMCFDRRKEIDRGGNNMWLIDIIRATLYLAKYLNIDIEKHIALKMKYNEGRPHRHGKED